MSNVNSVTISGNLTRDPETAWTSDDGESSIVKFGLASNRQRKGQDGEYVEETTFVDVEVFGKFAQLVGRKLRKGDSATVEGRLKYNEWEQEGNKRSKLILVAAEIDSDGFFRSKDEDNTPSAAPAAEKNEAPAAATTEAPASDDIPF